MGLSLREKARDDVPRGKKEGRATLANGRARAFSSVVPGAHLLGSGAPMVSLTHLGEIKRSLSRQ